MNGLIQGVRGLVAALSAASVVCAAQAASPLEEVCGACQAVRFAHCGGFLEGPTFDRDGTLWVVDLKGGGIMKVGGGRCTTVVNTGGSPNGARFHRDGRLFIADARKGLLILDPRTGALTVRADGSNGVSLEGANDLVFDEAGGLYMTVRGTSTELDRTGDVIYLPPGETSEPRIFADRLAFPNGIAISPDGMKVMIGLYADQSILAMTAVTNPAAFRMNGLFVRTEGGVGPDGIVFDAAGRLFWAEFGDGSIGVADAKGHPIGRIALPMDAGPNISNLAFHDGALYITEGSKGDVWRLPVKTPGAPLFHQH